MLQDSVDDQERKRYSQLIETVGWFFFDLFILGYVEDPITGHSFRFPGGMKWAIYVEVPSRIKMNGGMSLNEFFEDVPALGLLGTPYLVEPTVPYEVDEEVQLVCKYLRAFKIGGTKGINKLYKKGQLLNMPTASFGPRSRLLTWKQRGVYQSSPRVKFINWTWILCPLEYQLGRINLCATNWEYWNCIPHEIGEVKDWL